MGCERFEFSAGELGCLERLCLRRKARPDVVFLEGGKQLQGILSIGEGLQVFFPAEAIPASVP